MFSYIACYQTIPRVVVFDEKTKANLLQLPVEEVESLRLSSKEFNDVEIEPGSVVPLDVGTATQVYLCIFASSLSKQFLIIVLRSPALL